mgnify:CR=1 FL=1
MSFSGEIKEELSQKVSTARHCQIAELAAIMGMCGGVVITSGDRYRVKIQTDSLPVARKCFTLLQKIFNIEPEVSIRQHQKPQKTRIYNVLVPKHEDALRVLQALKLIDGHMEIRENLTAADNILLQRTCCKRAFIRGAFLSTGSMSDPKKAYHFEIVSKGFQHQYWQAVLKGAQEEADRLGVTMNFVGPNSESDIADQVQMLNSAINAKPAAIGLAALSTDACNDALQQAKDAGIPIVGFDSGVPGAPEGSVVANAATDNYAAGELAAEKTYEVLKDRIAAAEGSVRIGVMGQDATSESIINRGLGFIDKIAELAEADGYTVTVEGNDKYVQDCKVEPTKEAKVILDVAVPSQVTAELSATDCQTLLNKEDTICIYGSNQHSGEAMVTGNENLQKLGSGEDQVLGVTFDSGTVIKEAVKNGTLYGAITQAPVAMGAAVIDLLTMAANGEEVGDVDTEIGRAHV